jgi:hypothetical protein
MKTVILGVAVAATFQFATATGAQQMGSPDPATTNVAAAPAAVAPAVVPAVARIVLPTDTVVVVTPVQEITSKKMKEGDMQRLQVANDLVSNGVVVVPRGSPVTAMVTWRTGKGIGGKSAKFELTFQSVNVRGKDYALKGKWRQEGRGNTVAALLGSMLISGHSAVMTSGQMVNAFTAEDIVIS